ncbi:MAG: toll/interleukin-1 receptor domain-containing protein, partial [Chloroflexi bacterium]
MSQQEQVFISYKREDEAFAIQLRDKLRSWGYNTWRDKDDIAADESWAVGIDRGLKTSGIIIGVMTEKAVTSEQVFKEWMFAFINKRRLILLWLEDFDLDKLNYQFHSHQRVDFRQSHAAGFEALKNALQQAPQSTIVEPVKPSAETLPERGLIPPGSRMQYGENPNFVGREEELKQLAQSLFNANGNGGAANAAAITPAAAASGIGGVGKTQLAVEYAHRYGRYYYGVHWINMADLKATDETSLNSRLAEEIAACGQVMGLNLPPNDLGAQMQMTLQAWRSSAPRLIVLDNVEEAGVYNHIRQLLQGQHVLITTRVMDESRWRNLGATACPIKTLPREQSRQLLRKLAPRLNDVDDAELDALAERLGDLPLALDLAGRYLEQNQHLTPAAYLE